MNKLLSFTKIKGPALSRKLSFLLIAVLILFSFNACSQQGVKKEKYANYGSSGSEIALELAHSYPYRSPGSLQERAAAEFLAGKLQELGYFVVLQEFGYTDSAGIYKRSQNIVCQLDGTGFIKLSEEGEDTKLSIDRRWNLIGAHYDVAVTGPDYLPASEEKKEESEEIAAEEVDFEAEEELEDKEGEPSAEDEPDSEIDAGLDLDQELPSDLADLDKSSWQIKQEIKQPLDFGDFDGIHNNASGVASVITAAQIMQEDKPGYDIRFVLFGAGSDNHAGARAYLANLPAEDRLSFEAMYNVEGIYAGDKVYAHAGTNSVLTGNKKNYEFRRKLYEVTDVFYKYQLNTNNGYSLYTNQSGLRVNAGKGGSSIFSEWTSKSSDHTPFDLEGIPVVFIESGEYNIKNLDELGIESKNPSFSSTEGRISGTAFDSSSYLEALFMDMAKISEMDYLFLSPTVGPTAAQKDDISASQEEEEVIEMKDLPRLEQRINNTAFLLVKAMQREPAGTKLIRR